VGVASTATRHFDNSHPFEMNQNLFNERTSDRTLRLFACGCARRVWNILEERSRKVVEVSERYADRLADQAALEVALEQVKRYREAIPSFEEPG
jgi:hypothetical protein